MGESTLHFHDLLLGSEPQPSTPAPLPLPVYCPMPHYCLFTVNLQGETLCFSHKGIAMCFNSEFNNQPWYDQESMFLGGHTGRAGDD